MKKNVIYCVRLTLWETVFFLFVLLFFCNEAIFVGKLSCRFSYTLDCCSVNFHKYVFSWIFIFFPLHYHVALSYLRFLVAVTDQELLIRKISKGSLHGIPI